MKGLVSLCMLTNDVCPFAWVLLYERRDFADYARVQIRWRAVALGGFN